MAERLMRWLCFFYIYGFFGWCLESAYVSLKCGKPVNRGFVKGPFLPLYGSGGVLLLLVSAPFRRNPACIYFAGCIGATVLEFVTGASMQALFKVRYWDYSDKRFQIRGHICLSSTLVWGGLTLLMTQVVHKYVEGLVFAIPLPRLVVMTVLVTVLFGIDLICSFYFQALSVYFSSQYLQR